MAKTKKENKKQAEAVAQASRALNYMESLQKTNEETLATMNDKICELEASIKKKDDELQVLRCGTGSGDENKMASCIADSGASTAKLEQENACLKQKVDRLLSDIDSLCKQMKKIEKEKTDQCNEQPQRRSSGGACETATTTDLEREIECLKKELAEAKDNLEDASKQLNVSRGEIV